ncbi:MAG: LytTR family transcriptional regulator DNA-binding domain-containing protein [Anaerolineales bacterium]|nr:LytTR family transcriptional regulator DNA-binding domain-containing protein [Anaerolineales bacterium]
MIELKNLQKNIQGNTAINIDSLNVSRGEVVALVGPVGSGKKPLFELLIGKIKPTMGTVRINGIDPAEDKDAFSQEVGVLFAEDSLYAKRTAKQNLAFYSKLRGIDKSRITGFLNEAGLADQANVRVDKLSSSLVRRLSFANAILHQPKALILVEPLSRCDQTTINFLKKRIREVAEEDVAILILGNNTANLIDLCDRVYILNQGEITESDLSQSESEIAPPFKIPVRLEGKVALVNPGDILFADTQDSKTYLNTSEGRLQTQFTMEELEKRLARSGFFRAHRTFLVNLQHVKEVIPYTRNSYSMRLDDEGNTEIPLSKSAAAELRDLLGY